MNNEATGWTRALLIGKAQMLKTSNSRNLLLGLILILAALSLVPAASAQCANCGAFSVTSSPVTAAASPNPSTGSTPVFSGYGKFTVTIATS
jgi:hypothetical protein